MRYMRMIFAFIRSGFLEDSAYRENFFINFFSALLSLGTGLAAIEIVFNQTQAINGWSRMQVFAVFGVYQTLNALRGLFIGPSLDSLAGMDGDVWSGRLDFTLLRPVSLQFLVSVRKWRLFELFNLLAGIAILVFTMQSLSMSLSFGQLAFFILALSVAFLMLYAILLILTALVFWSPGILFSWIFNGIFQMARYPLDLYPGWLRWVLTWIVPIGVITTLPAQALTQQISWSALAVFAALTACANLAAAVLLKRGASKYSSASS
jgi:ABC-2 type transport system permease protein